MSLFEKSVKIFGTSALIENARRFWFNNESGSFYAGELEITRRQIDAYGGPNPQFNGCQTCQLTEWLSRVTQSNRFVDHSCDTAALCRYLCERQGDDRWTHLHQNFWFALGTSDQYRAPRVAVFHQARWLPAFMSYGGSHILINRRRALARLGTWDLLPLNSYEHTDWSKYDAVMMSNHRQMPLYERTPPPLVMWGMDCWRGNPQEALWHYRPDSFMTPVPSMWADNVRIPPDVPVDFVAVSATQFFTRPNLADKRYDLACLGAVEGEKRQPKKDLHRQIERLPSRYSVTHNHRKQYGAALAKSPLNIDAPLLNKYSEYIGQARYAISGNCCLGAKQAMTIKTYEMLGSGAIPIMPKLADYSYLGIEEGVHYINVARIESNNDYLVYLLDSYDEHRHIAEAAVAWHKASADKLTLGRFERIFRRVIGGKYEMRRTG